MTETALDRVARALDLIPFITANPGLSVIEIAERFNSTPTQISKDLSLLHMCGLPGYSHLELLDIDYEDPNYVAVTDPQVLDAPRSLSQLEAVTLILGLQTLTEVASSEVERNSINDLKERIMAKYGDSLTRSIQVADAIVDSPNSASIGRAISEKKWLDIEYNSASSDSISHRTIFPFDLEYQSGIGYVHAFEAVSKVTKTFRLDRILRLEVLDEVKAPTAMDARVIEAARENWDISSVTEVTIETGPDGFFFIERHNEIVISFEKIATGYLITLRVIAGEWLIRTLLSWPAKIKILDPLSLAQEVNKRLKSSLDNYA